MPVNAPVAKRTFVGVEGGVTSTAGGPEQGAPLTVQPRGSPLPLATQPKLVEAPAVSVPFHDVLVKTKWPPSRVMFAFQYEPSVVPAGRSNSTRHELSVAGPGLCTVILPT